MNNLNTNQARAITYNHNDRRGGFYNSHQLQYSSKRHAALTKQKQEKMNRILLLSCAALVLIFCLFFCMFHFSKGSVASAHASDSNVVSYISIEVVSGDNLWSISKDNKTTTMTTKQYMNEIIQLNQLSSNELFAGKFILIPVYN